MVNHNEGTTLAIEPYEKIDNPNWPEPQMLNVKNGKIHLTNKTNNAVLLGSEVKLCKVTATSIATPSDSSYYNYEGITDTSLNSRNNRLENIKLITHNKSLSQEANKLLTRPI